MLCKNILFWCQHVLSCLGRFAPRHGRRAEVSFTPELRPLFDEILQVRTGLLKVNTPQTGTQVYESKHMRAHIREHTCESSVKICTSRITKCGKRKTQTHLTAVPSSDVQQCIASSNKCPTSSNKFELN